MDFFTEMIFLVPVLLISLTLHEYFHGYVAYKLGDNTAKDLGRLTLNPLKHLDPFGTMCLLVFHFGWAKPVPVNPYNFIGDRKKGMLKVAIAGPATNFSLAFISSLLLAFISKFLPSVYSGFFGDFVYLMVIINIGLGIFNLFPVPPLDGYRVFDYFMPPSFSEFVRKYEQWGMIVLIGLLTFHIIDVPLGFLINSIKYLFLSIAGFIF